jgi:hypothetical protein
MESFLSRVTKFEKNKLFEIDYKVLALLGFTPERMLNVRSFFIFTLSLLLEVLPEFYFIVRHINDVQAVFMCLHEFFSLLVYVLKVFVFFFHRHNLVSLVGDLKQEWNDCKLHYILDLSKLFSLTIYSPSKAFTEHNPRWMKTGHDLEKLIFKTSRNFYFFIFTSGLFYFTIPIIIHFLFLDGTSSPVWPVPVQV